MEHIGSRLKERREQRKLSLEDVFEATKIRISHLRAIERGAYDELPGEVFAKGYVRSFAEAVGLDPAAVASDYDEERRASGAVDEEAVGRERERAARAALEALSERSGRGIRRIRIGRIAGVVTMVLVLGAAVGWLALRERNPLGAVPSETPAPAVVRSDAASVERAVDTTAVEPSFDESGNETDETVSGDSETDSIPAPAPAIVDGPGRPPVEAPERETAEPVAASAPTVDASARLSITEFGVGTGVENRVLVGRNDRFDAGERCVFWTRVIGGRDGDGIRHRWLHDGAVAMSVTLPIGGAHWRTHSTHRPEAPGEWVVEARDEEDRLLARATFAVRN